MEVTMISRGVEISIAGGVAETQDVHKLAKGSHLYILRAGSILIDSRDVFGIMSKVRMTVSLMIGCYHSGIH